MVHISWHPDTYSCSITLPLSKSIINRLLVINHLAGNGEVAGLENESDDIHLMQELLKKISDKNSSYESVNELYTGHAGTVLRFLAGVLSITPGSWLITGSSRMQQRPVKPLAEALLQLGAGLVYTANEGFPPLLIKGNKNLKGSKVSLDASVSSQFISSLMLIGPKLKNGLTIQLKGEIISGSYIKMTETLMKEAKADVRFEGTNIVIKPGNYKLVNFYSQVEHDWSSAAFWFEIVALAPKLQITLKGLTEQNVQGDSVLPQIFSHMGVSSSFTDDGLVIKGSENAPVQEFNYDFTLCPDLAQAVIVTCAAKGIKGIFKGLKTLRVKETDRIQALVEELAKFGFRLEVLNDQIFLNSSELKKPINRKQIAVECYDDHRMAMSFAPLALMGYEIGMVDPAVVSKSYPGFWNDLKAAGFNMK